MAGRSTRLCRPRPADRQDRTERGRLPCRRYETGHYSFYFLPLQSGVGNIANAVLGALGRDKTIPAFEMYTEVIQNSVIGLIRDGRVKFGSACSLTVTNDCLNGIYEDMDFFRDKLVLRPSEISNSPEIVRRLGVISINTAIEADLYGNVNSTHIGGTKMMNGIGGSGDFTRNAYISIFTCPSVAKEGKISAIVPMVSHVDHSEHDVNIIVTEQGVPTCAARARKNAHKPSSKTAFIRTTRISCGIT